MWWRPTEECSNEECGEWDVDDWGDHVDEPVGQERRDAQEHNVVEQVITVSLHLNQHRQSHLQLHDLSVYTVSQNKKLCYCRQTAWRNVSVEFLPTAA